MKILANVLDRQYFKYQDEYEKVALDVLRSGYYIMGPQVKAFEEEFATYIGGKYCVSLANGLDALWISLNCLGVKAGDEVLVQSNTYVATVNSIVMNGATPIFVEPTIFDNMDDDIEHLISDKTKAILVTHLYGQATRMRKFQDIAKKHNLFLLEDCAQSHGAKYKNQITGTFGDVGCFSFYPSKNLGCFGDGGAIVTDNKELADKIRTFRNYGSNVRYHNEMIGTNSRLDELQAAMLRVKLTHLDELNNERISLANQVIAKVQNPYIQLPQVDMDCESIWHLFVVKTKHRNELVDYLTKQDIHTLIHYPIPPHLQKSYEYLGYKEGAYPISEQYAKEVLTIPMYNGMTQEEIDYVINALNGFSI